MNRFIEALHAGDRRAYAVIYNGGGASVYQASELHGGKRHQQAQRGRRCFANGSGNGVQHRFTHSGHSGDNRIYDGGNEAYGQQVLIA